VLMVKDAAAPITGCPAKSSSSDRSKMRACQWYCGPAGLRKMDSNCRSSPVI
jgi:hypothetical protein